MDQKDNGDTKPEEAENGYKELKKQSDTRCASKGSNEHSNGHSNEAPGEHQNGHSNGYHLNGHRRINGPNNQIYPKPFAANPFYGWVPEKSVLQSTQTSRTVVIKNIAPHNSVHHVLNEVDCGPIESCRVMSRQTLKNALITNHANQALQPLQTCYISFVNGKTASQFYSKHRNPKRLRETLKSPHLRVVLGENVMDCIRLDVLNHILDHGATRCVLVSFYVPVGTKETERNAVHDYIQSQCEHFGEVEDFRVLSYDMNENGRLNGQVLIHFTSVAAAIRAHDHFINERLNLEVLKISEEDPIKEGDKVKDPLFSSRPPFLDISYASYHQDRCDRSKKDSLDALFDVSVASSDLSDSSDEFESSYFPPIKHEEPTYDQWRHIYSMSPMSPFPPIYDFSRSSIAMDPNYGNRTVYLGKLHPNTTVEEIANNVRVGGLVESINFHPDKKVCFITFIDAHIAYNFHLNHQVLHQLIIHGNDVDVGWAKKKSGPLSREIALAVTAGATRNVYIGVNSAQPVPLPDEPTLRNDFSRFGGLEQINFYHNGGCGFINFIRIADAIKVVQAFEIKEPERAIENITKLSKRGDSRNDIESFYYKYKQFKIKFAKDRCGNQPKFSFKKKPANSQLSTYQQYHHLLRDSVKGRQKQREEKKNLHSFMQDTIDQEAAMVFGIISGEKEDKKEDDKKESSSPSKDSSAMSLKDSDSDSDDEVSIITNSDDAASYTAQNPHVPLQTPRRFNQRNSRTSSSASLNRKHEMIPPNFNISPFITNQQPHLPTSRVRTRFASPCMPYYTYYDKKGYSTSGSQIMAQYLAKNQQENMMYAADLMGEEDYAYDWDDEERGKADKNVQ